jgi:dCMP deaminase
MRPEFDEWAMTLAAHVATRSTCLRRAVGCVLVNQHRYILATGYNGVARNAAHCNEELDGKFPFACAGATAASGTELDACDAIHAEVNALLQCRDINEIVSCYTTVSPCITCVKLLLNTSCQRIVFLTEYPHRHARLLWLAANRAWLKFERR